MSEASLARQSTPGRQQRGLPLEGQVALVSGATGHVGGASAHALAEMGARVAVHYLRQRERAIALAESLGGDQVHAPIQGDLANFAAAQRVVAEATQALAAPPTILVDAAYPAQGQCYVRDLTNDYVDQHLQGLRSHLNVCHAVLPGMRKARWGRIVVMSGALAWRPFPGFSIYAAMKAGAAAFARTLALEEGRAGVTVNTIALGRIESSSGENAFTPDPGYEALEEVTRLRVALPRMASPDDVAATVRYLVSPDSEAVTGQVIFLAAGEPT